MDKKAKYEMIKIGNIWCSTEKRTEADNYMPQIDQVQAMRMKPQYTEEDYDPTGFKRALNESTVDEISTYKREMAEGFNHSYKNYTRYHKTSDKSDKKD